MNWAVLCRSHNQLDGKREYFMWLAGQPLLFATRRQAKEWIDANYGYLRSRPDLRKEPHGWRIPLAMRVTVKLEPCGIRGGSKPKRTSKKQRG